MKAPIVTWIEIVKDSAQLIQTLKMNQNQIAVAQINNGPLVKLFHKRNAIYKSGLILLFPNLVLYTVSFCFDTWFSSRETNHSYGIWKKCYDDKVSCVGKIDTVVALQVISLIFLAGICVAIVVGLLENCHPRPENYHSRKLEWIVLSTALTGTGESFVFLIYFASLWRVSMGISFFLNSIVVAVLFVAVGLMAFGNRRPSTRRQGVVVTSPIVTQQPMTTVYYSPRPQVQTHVYNYHSGSTNLPPASNLPYGAPTNTNVAALPPSYGAYPSPPSGSPPPPYMLPPMYPHQGSHQACLPPPYDQLKQEEQQRQLEASAPLLSDIEMKPKL